MGRRYMGKRLGLVFTYTVGHFVVDFACAFLMFRLLFDTEQWYLSLLLYNFCAFALQMPLGLIADRWNRNAVCATIGCGLIALSYGLSGMVVLTAVVAGIGNGLFHVGGGIDVLNISKDKPTLLGIFVSPGALGIYLGTILGKQDSIPILLMVMALLMIGAFILLVNFTYNRSFRSDNVPISFRGITSSGTIVAVSCFLAVVCLRSYIGLISSFPWKSQWVWGIGYICSVVIGKIAGGFLAVKLGAMKASIISLGLATILFLFSGYPVFGIAAVLFFNMSMPITLWAVARLLTGSKGFSFGLLTFGLFLGFIPVYLGFNSLLSTTWGFAIAAFGSLILLWIGLRKAVL